MKNIFVLTKNEQRVVIVALMLLVAATVAKHYLDNRSQLPSTRSTSPVPNAATPHSPGEDEQTAADDSP